MKQEQRTFIRKRLSEFSDKEKASQKIIERAIQNEHYKTAQKIAVFLATDGEPDTLPILAHALQNGKRIFAPVTHEGMTFVEITEKTTFSRGKFGIIEPIGEEYTEDFDLIFVPMLAFDDEKNRLGHGKGYYDRFLQNKQIYTIGLAFSCQKLDKVETEPFDIKMDEIITD